MRDLSKRNHVLNPEPYSSGRKPKTERLISEGGSVETKRAGLGEEKRGESEERRREDITVISNSGDCPPDPLYL